MKKIGEQILPQDIETRSFEIITQELGETNHTPEELLVLKRVIHTAADFDYKANLTFTPEGVAKGIAALKNGATIVTDTQMVRAGINKKIMAKLGGQVLCFMADDDVAAQAKREGTTRGTASMDKLADIQGDLIVAIGNAPTALIRLCELIEEGVVAPKLVIGVPVGFVNVVESKELLLSLDQPSIVAKGRKGGSNVAAAICNAMIYQIMR